MNFPSLQERSGSLARNFMKLAIAMLVLSLLSFLLWARNPLVIEEDHIIEWAQSILLLLACCMHVVQVFRLKTSSVEFVVRSGLGLLVISFALRELDIDRFGESEIWALVERVLRLTAAALWISLLILSIRRIKQIFAYRLIILTMPALVLTFWGCLFFVVAWPFDKELVLSLSQGHSRLIEEILELNACFILLAASMANTSVQSSVAYRSAEQQKEPLEGTAETAPSGNSASSR